MNEQESIAFLSDVAFVAFPSVRQWLLTTDRYNETVKMMAKGLSDINRDEAKAVIDSWITGRVEAPKYLRDGFVLHIRACAMDIRASEALRKRKIEDEQKQKPVPKAMQSVKLCGLWTEHWLPIRFKIDSGELSPEDGLAEWAVIVDRASTARVKFTMETDMEDDSEWQ